MDYYNRSVELGNSDAQFALGFMWGTGKGVPQNTALVCLSYDETFLYSSTEVVELQNQPDGKYANSPYF